MPFPGPASGPRPGPTITLESDVPVIDWGHRSALGDRKAPPHAETPSKWPLEKMIALLNNSIVRWNGSGLIESESD